MSKRDIEEDFWDAEDVTGDGPFYHGWKAALIAAIALGIIVTALYGIKSVILG
jgi:hypothetical protein